MVSREPPLCGWRLKSTGSFDGFLFSVRWEPEGLGQVQGGVVQRQPMNGSPEIDRVALHSAILLEASKSILAQVDRKGPFPIRRMAVHRTTPATLETAAAKMMQQIRDAVAPVPARLAGARMRNQRAGVRRQADALA